MFVGVVGKSKLGQDIVRLPEVVLAGEGRRGRGVVGNSLSKRFSVFGVGTRKQEGERIVVGLGDVVKGEVVIVSIKDKGVSYIIVSVILNVGGTSVAGKVAMLLENIQGMLLKLFGLWRAWM